MKTGTLSIALVQNVSGSGQNAQPTDVPNPRISSDTAESWRGLWPGKSLRSPAQAFSRSALFKINENLQAERTWDVQI